LVRKRSTVQSCSTAQKEFFNLIETLEHPPDSYRIEKVNSSILFNSSKQVVNA
jgi:hypothetical protein